MRPDRPKAMGVAAVLRGAGPGRRQRSREPRARRQQVRGDPEKALQARGGVCSGDLQVRAVSLALSLRSSGVAAHACSHSLSGELQAQPVGSAPP